MILAIWYINVKIVVQGGLLPSSAWRSMHDSDRKRGQGWVDGIGHTSICVRLALLFGERWFERLAVGSLMI